MSACNFQLFPALKQSPRLPTSGYLYPLKWSFGRVLRKRKPLDIGYLQSSGKPLGGSGAGVRVVHVLLVAQLVSEQVLEIPRFAGFSKIRFVVGPAIP